MIQAFITSDSNVRRKDVQVDRAGPGCRRRWYCWLRCIPDDGGLSLKKFLICFNNEATRKLYRLSDRYDRAEYAGILIFLKRLKLQYLEI